MRQVDWIMKQVGVILIVMAFGLFVIASFVAFQGYAQTILLRETTVLVKAVQKQNKVIIQLDSTVSKQRVQIERSKLGTKRLATMMLHDHRRLDAALERQSRLQQQLEASARSTRRLRREITRLKRAQRTQLALR